MLNVKSTGVLAAVAGALALAIIVACLPVKAQGPGGPKVVSIAASAAPSSAAPGASGKLVISVKVAPGYHIQAAKPTDPNLIATAFAPKAAPGVHFGTAQYPKPVDIKVAGASGPTPVYVGAVKITVPYTVTRSAKAGKMAVGGTLTYQACNQASCYPPQNDPVSAKVIVK